VVFVCKISDTPVLDVSATNRPPSGQKGTQEAPSTCGIREVGKSTDFLVKIGFSGLGSMCGHRENAEKFNTKIMQPLKKLPITCIYSFIGFGRRAYYINTVTLLIDLV
jgi:hypothetical protein